MNRRFRAGELSLHEIAQNLQPVGNVDRITSPGGAPSLPVPSGEKSSAEGIASESRSGETAIELAPEGPAPTKDSSQSQPADAPSAESLDTLRRDALEAMHNYVVAATGHNLARSMTVFRRVLWTLDSHLGHEAERSR